MGRGVGGTGLGVVVMVETLPACLRLPSCPHRRGKERARRVATYERRHSAMLAGAAGGAPQTWITMSELRSVTLKNMFSSHDGFRSRRTTAVERFTFSTRTCGHEG